jgi:hypothetical protein
MKLLYDITNLSIILFISDQFILLTLQTDNKNVVLMRHNEILSNVSLVKTDHFIIDKASSIFIIPSISLIKSWLDISNLLSTKLNRLDL